MRPRRHIIALFLAIAAVALAIGWGLGELVTDDDTATTTAIDGRGDTVEVQAPDAAVDAAADSNIGDHQGLRTETPAIAPEQDLVNAARQQERIRNTLTPLPTAGASENVPGCTTRFIGSQSSRNGVRPRIQVYHYTVSPNRAGWDDVWGIVNYFAGVQASSNFVIDAEGHCAYIVPIENKAWTQASLNPVSVSYEIVNTGNEGRYLDTPGYRKLASVTRWVAARTGIPIRLGTVAACTVTRTGIVDHRMGGACAGGHGDIAPYSIVDTIRIVAGDTGTATSHLTKGEAAVAYKRCYHRRQHLAGKDVATNLKWARFYRDRILIPSNRAAPVGGHVQLITAIDRAKAQDGKPWSYRHRGTRRKALAAVYTGKGC